MISRSDIEIFCSIAKAGSDYILIKQLLTSAQWKVKDDEVDLGYLRVDVPDVVDGQYELTICYRDPGHPPFSLLQFYALPDSAENLAAFNLVFQSVADTLTEYLGAPTSAGFHQLSFRTWPYEYKRWSRPEADLTLVQDELDIQFGMDITLWAHPVGTPIDVALRR